MECVKIKEEIKELLADNEASQRKNITLSLPKSILNELDEIGEIAGELCGKSISRQYLIESSLIAYIKEFKEVLYSEYGVCAIQNRKNERDKQGDFVLVVPAFEEGFNETFIGSKEWYWLRIGSDKLDKIKYLAIYVNAPVSAITHYAKIDKLVKYSSGYKAILSDIYKLDNSIPLGKINALYTRPNRYVTLEKLFSAKTYEDLVEV